MVLKRKRSVSELSCSSASTSSSAFNSPPHANSILMDFSPMSGSTINSRTMKRFRNNRPSDQQVHRKFYEWRAHHRRKSSSSSERTLNLLYSAQQQQPQQQQDMSGMPPPPSHGQPQEQFVRTQHAQPQQSSLHRFWNIHTQPQSNAPLNTVTERPTTCDDCGNGLGDAMSMDVDVNADSSATACGACGKHVCFSCSVSNLGELRRCLQCAGKKVWVGGIGWTETTMPVC